MNEPRDEILYVDDSADDRLFTRLLFERGNYSFGLTIVDDAASALSTIEQRIAQAKPLPTLLVTDHYMPLTDGPELIRIVRADSRLASMMVAMCSGGDDPADVQAAMEAGALHHLGKPLDFDLCRDILAGSLASLS